MPKLSVLAKEAYLERYRTAVGRYKPLIEERTGIGLGDICVKDIKHLDSDFLRDEVSELKSEGRGYLYIAALYALSWPISKVSSIKDRKDIVAKYYNSSIYVAFNREPSDLDEKVDQDVVHELTHCLWERLGGSYDISMGRESKERWRNISEAYANYGQKVWFSDFYHNYDFENSSLSDAVDAWKISRLEDIYGERVLFRIPKAWEELAKELEQLPPDEVSIGLEKLKKMDEELLTIWEKLPKELKKSFTINKKKEKLKKFFS